MNDIHIISDTTETITNKTSVCSKLYVRSMCATAHTQCLFTTVVLLYIISHSSPVLNGAGDVRALAGAGLHVGRVRDLVVDGDPRGAGQGAPSNHGLEADL